MSDIKSLTKPHQDKEMEIHSENECRSDALRRAEAFPVKGGEILPAQRKSWFKTVEQRERPTTETA